MLQVLNHYIDCLSKGLPLFQRRIRFYLAHVSHMRTLEVELPASGSLMPLFNAFGLITAEELSTHSPYTGTGCSIAVMMTAVHGLLVPGIASRSQQSTARLNDPQQACKDSLADNNCHADFSPESLAVYHLL